MTRWPAVLVDGAVRLRPLGRRDGAQWLRVRRANADWLEPWEATVPGPQTGPGPSFGSYVAGLRREARAGRAMPLVIEHGGRLAGQITATGIQMGSLRSASLGYWVAREHAGRGIAPTAVALLTDHLWSGAGLHRVEIAIRPENAASLRVVAKLGFREEGLRPRYLHIDGQWRDHRVFALTVEEVPGGLLRRWREAQAAG